MSKIYIDKHKSLLIIGKADTYRNVLNPTYEDNLDEVKITYGVDSQLTKGFELAQKLGVPHIFLLNCQNYYDFFEISGLINQHDFTYITPLNVYMSDVTYLPSNSRNKTTCISQLMSDIRRQSDSVFIMTDKHASLYEDVDAFISDMNAIERNFLNTRYTNLNLENIIFAANNVKGIEYANVCVAAALITSPMNEYPSTPVTSAIFRLDRFDNIGSWAYFQNHYLSGVSIENLLNQRPTGDALKIVTISRIAKMIKRDLSFDDFIGKHYSEYRRIQIGRRIEEYLQSLKGNIIIDYKILNIFANKQSSATVTINASFTVKLVNCIDSIQIDIPVEVGI